MHNINYGYAANKNRLASITATGLNSSSYIYDAIGNLTGDSGEDIQVQWNAAGKVKQVVTPEYTIKYTYNPLGQRQSKEVIGDSTVKEWYLHDATGNIMCVYRKLPSVLHIIYATEQPIYGSKRLGVYQRNKEIYESGMKLTSTDTISFSGKRGDNRYELTDHLGNIMSVVSDRKIGVGSTGVISYYSPEVLSWTDYYPFGYPITNRSANLADYRFGFNGQEKDNEVYGEGKSYDFGERIYDSRIGRWFSIDHLSKKIPGISPYSFAYNSPILFKDVGGKAGIVTVTENAGGGGTITIESIIFVYGDGAKEAAMEANRTWESGVKQGHNTYTYYDENNKPWIVTVNAVFVYTESLDAAKTVNENQRDISSGNVQVTGTHPATGEVYEYQYPGYGGSMIAAKVGSYTELMRVSGEPDENVLGWGSEAGGLSGLTGNAFIHEMFHGFGLGGHLYGSENAEDVLFVYGGGTKVNPIHFIDFSETILKRYKEGRFENGIPSSYNSAYPRTPSDQRDEKLQEQEERREIYESGN